MMILPQTHETLYNITEALLWESQKQTRLLEKQIEFFERAVYSLEWPRTTEANEALARGLERLNYGWLEEAQEEFERCLKLNSTDFLGHFFTAAVKYQQDLLEDALSYAHKATKYAKPYSDRWTSLSLAFLARIHHTESRYTEASKSASQAILADDSCAVAHYEAARAQSSLKNIGKVTKSLQTAISIDSELFNLATGDHAFDHSRDEVDQLQNRLLTEKQRKLGEEIQRRKLLTQVGSGIGASYPLLEDGPDTYPSDARAIETQKMSGDYPEVTRALALTIDANDQFKNGIEVKIENRRARLLRRKEDVQKVPVLQKFTLYFTGGVSLFFFCAFSWINSSFAKLYVIMWFFLAIPLISFFGYALSIYVFKPLNDKPELSRIEGQIVALNKLKEALKSIG